MADDTDREIGKLRRLALAVGLVLFTVAIAGVELQSPAVIHPLGIPLNVKRPNVLGIGLCLASIYATTRYWFYGFVLTTSPIGYRRMIRRGQQIGPPIGSPTEFNRAYSQLVGRYYPPVGRKRATFTPGPNENPIQKLRIPFWSRALAGLENLDYLAPIFVNAIAFFTYVGPSLFQTTYPMVRSLFGH